MNPDDYIQARQETAGPIPAKRSRERLRSFEAFRQGREITQALLVDYQLHLHRKALSPATINRYCNEVKAMLHYFRRRGESSLNRDAVSDALRHERVPRTLPRILDYDDLKKIMATLLRDSRLYTTSIRPLVLVGLATGMRPGELANLLGTDVDPRLKEIKVYSNKTKIERRVPYSDAPILGKAIEHLATYTGKIIRFPSKENWARFAYEAGIKRVPIRILRATAETYVACGSTYNEYLLTARFGHTSAIAMKHYRIPNFNIQGTTVEEWLGCKDLIEQVVAKCLTHTRITPCATPS